MHCFLDGYNWKLIESEDTALSARNISVGKKKNAAAIASTLAAVILPSEDFAGWYAAAVFTKAGTSNP